MRYEKITLFVSDIYGSKPLKNSNLAVRLIKLCDIILGDIDERLPFDYEAALFILERYHKDLVAKYPNLHNINELYEDTRASLIEKSN